MSEEPLRQRLVQAFVTALHSLRFDRLTSAALAPRPLGRVNLLAAGKAAAMMSSGASGALANQIDQAIVVVPHAVGALALPPGFRVLRASHPTPDASSEAAARAALDLASRTPPSATLLVLVSGGASSLLCAPAPGITLQRKSALVGDLLRSGASIQEINTVRRHVSAIKGGRLAMATQARVETLYASDVVGGLAHDVGSGPSCEDPTSVAEALEVLVRVLGESQAASWASHLSQGLPTGSAASHRLAARCIASPETLREAVAAQLAALGFACVSQVTRRATVDELAHAMLEQCAALEPRQAAVITCEPLVRVPPDAGVGGRAGRVALSLLRSGRMPSGTAALCGASDGADGSSGAAGACVTAQQAGAADPCVMQRAWEQYDDAGLHRAMGSRIETGPTGLNLTDVYVCARG